MFRILKDEGTTISHAKRLSVVVGLFHCFRLLTGAITAAFLLKSGVALRDLAILQIIFSSTTLIANYPIGLLCDKYGGKYFAYFACLIISIFCILCTFAPNIKILIAAHFLNSLGLSCISCAASAWVVALIKLENNQNKNYINYLGHLCGEIESIGGIISGLIGALLVFAFYGQGYIYVFYITSILMFALSFVVLSIPYIPKNSSLAKSPTITKIVKYNISEIIHNREVIAFLLVSSCMVVLFQPIYHYWQPYFTTFEITKKIDESIILGLCFALFSLTKYIFNNYIKSLLVKNRNIDLMKMAIILTSLLPPIFYCIAGNKKSFLAACVLFCMLHGLMSIISRIIAGQYLKTASEDTAASIMSLAEISGRLLAIGYFAILYKTVDQISVGGIFYLSCVVSIVVWLGLISWKKSLTNKQFLAYSN